MKKKRERETVFFIPERKKPTTGATVSKTPVEARARTAFEVGFDPRVRARVTPEHVHLRFVHTKVLKLRCRSSSLRFGKYPAFVPQRTSKAFETH